MVVEVEVNDEAGGDGHVRVVAVTYVASFATTVLVLKSEKTHE